MSRHTAFPLTRQSLDNGLRLLVAEDHSSPVVAVAVLYDVGYRSEPEGRTGFAHLFEHLMFQGSARLGKMEHVSRIMGNGGTLNGTTTPDFTRYHEAVPSGALELALYLEADRMRSVAVTVENLANQIDVVKEEIRANVLNRPYGGFPWIKLPAAMFDTFPNAHDGYGSFDDLEAASVTDAADFFNSYYSPGNALVVVVGDTTPQLATTLVERHFGDIPHRMTPEVPDFNEPPPNAERVVVGRDRQAPTPAVALGYRAPDPLTALDDLAVLEVLAAVMTSGRGSRLQKRLIREKGLITSIGAWIGESPAFGGPLEVRGPTWFQFVAYYPQRASRLQIIEEIDLSLAAMVAGGVTPDELDRAKAQLISGLWRGLDGFINRALALAPLELHRGRAELAWEAADLIAAVTAGDVARVTAEWLRPQLRTVLEIVPGNES